jgi:hypothetical protein
MFTSFEPCVAAFSFLAIFFKLAEKEPKKNKKVVKKKITRLYMKFQ